MPIDQDGRVGDLEEEVAFWRRDAAARLQMAIWLHRGCEQRGEEQRAAEVRIGMRSTLAAFERADAKDWHERCEMCGEFMRPGQPLGRIELEPESQTSVHAACIGEAGHPDDLDEATVRAEAQAILDQPDDAEEAGDDA